MELKDIKDSSVKIETGNQADSQKKVGFWFGLGIFIAPYIFGWFTLKQGYSKTARVVAFSWLFLVVVVNLNKHDNSSRSTASVAESMTQEKSEDFTMTGLDSKLSKFDSPMIVGKIKNNTNKNYSYIQVSFNLYDKSGAQVGSTMANLANFEANGTWKFEALMNEEKAHTYKLQKITAY